MSNLARARRRTLGRPRATSCRNPTYGRVLGGGILGSLIRFAGAGLGAVTGAALAQAATAGADAETVKRARITGGSMGMIIGYGAGVYPGLLVNRGILRNPKCTNPSLGKIFFYDLANVGISIGAGAAARKIEPNVMPAVVAIGGLFTLPLLGKVMIKET